MTLLLPRSIEQKRENVTNSTTSIDVQDDNSEQTNDVELVSVKTSLEKETSDIQTQNVISQRI